MSGERAPLLHALSSEAQAAIKDCLSKSQLLAFLDYDGTCTPIVKNPEDACLSAEMARVLELFTRTYPTSFVSGRGRNKVKKFVGIDSALYAGSHGFEIEGSMMGKYIKHDVAEGHKAALAQAIEELTRELADVPRAVVEDNTFSVSVHYRNVDPSLHSRVEHVVDKVLSHITQLVKRPGKCVFELRPAIDWHKGRAVEYILSQLSVTGATVLVMGDDMTDEDMFLSAQHKADEDASITPLTILVAEDGQAPGTYESAVPPRATHARYYVRNPDEVRTFLRTLLGKLADGC